MPIIEIYLLIKIGSEIGAITTILLIFTTAVFLGAIMGEIEYNWAIVWMFGWATNLSLPSM